MSYFCDNIPDSAPRPGVDKARRIPEALIYWSLARFTTYLAQDQIESLSGPELVSTVLICMSPCVQCPHVTSVQINGLIALLPRCFPLPSDHVTMPPNLNISIFQVTGGLSSVWAVSTPARVCSTESSRQTKASTLRMTTVAFSGIISIFASWALSSKHICLPLWPLRQQHLSTLHI